MDLESHGAPDPSSRSEKRSTPRGGDASALSCGDGPLGRRPLITATLLAPRGRCPPRRLEPRHQGQRRPIRRGVGTVRGRRAGVRAVPRAHGPAVASGVADAGLLVDHPLRVLVGPRSCLRHRRLWLAYPLAHGGGALLAGLGGALFLDDELGALAWVGVAVVAIGLASTVRPTTSRAALGWAGLTAVTISAYTLIDAVGSRRSSGLAYGFTLFITAGAAMTVVGVVSGRGPAFVAALPARGGDSFSPERPRPRVRARAGGCPAGAGRLRRHLPRVLRRSRPLSRAGGCCTSAWRGARVVSAVVVVCGMALLIAGR